MWKSTRGRKVSWGKAPVSKKSKCFSGAGRSDKRGVMMGSGLGRALHHPCSVGFLLMFCFLRTMSATLLLESCPPYMRSNAPPQADCANVVEQWVECIGEANLERLYGRQSTGNCVVPLRELRDNQT